MGPLSVTEALNQRKSACVFLSRPVAAPMVHEILELAGRSPSGCNLQPWKVYALSGNVKNRLCDLVTKRRVANPEGEQADISVAPSVLCEPWSSRRENSIDVIYDALNISGEAHGGCVGEIAKEFSFYNAPVGLIVTMDRSLSESQMIDTGMFLHSILLLACERGLATCAQSSWALWPNTVREVLGIADSEMIMAGVALGYAKPDEPVNDISQPRLAPEQFISMQGF